jgi:hypothetical protein
MHSSQDHFASSGLLSALVVCGCLAILGCGAPDGELVRESLRVAPQELDLGAVWSTCRFEHTLHVRNDSTDTIEVSQLLVDCPCVQVSPSTFSIPPGASQSVSVVVDLTATRGAEGAEFSTKITPILKGKHFPTPWKLTGQVREFFAERVEPLRFQLPWAGPGATTVSSSSPVTRTLRVPLARLEAELDPPVAAVDVHLTSHSVDFLCLEDGSCRPGRTPLRLRLRGETMDGESFTTVLRAEVVKALGYTCTPAVVHLGTVPVGASAGEVVDIAFVYPVSEFACIAPEELPELTVQCDAPVGSADSFRMNCILSAASPGVRQGTIRLQATLAGSPIEWTLPVTYYGRSP